MMNIKAAIFGGIAYILGSMLCVGFNFNSELSFAIGSIVGVSCAGYSAILAIRK